MAPLSWGLRLVEQELVVHANWLKEIENQYGQKNIRIMGLPKKVDGREPTKFMEKWLLEKFEPKEPSPLFMVEKAYRASAKGSESIKTL